MRFLCVSDQIDPLVYATSAKERYKDVDAVFCAGDLPMDYVDYIVTMLNKPTFFVFGNHDLKEFPYYHKPAPGGTAMDAMKHSHGGDYVSNRVLVCRNLPLTLPNGKTTPLLVAGVSGSIRYNDGLDQYTNGEMMVQLLRMAPRLLWNKIRYGRCCDVFLTHASPRHIHDREDPCHKGFECFNWFIRKFSPALLVHGHIHLYDLQAVRTTVSGGTTVVNAYSRVVIDFNPAPAEDGAKGDRFNAVISVHADQ